MDLSNDYRIIYDFLKSLIDIENWEEAVLNVEIQPLVQGVNGYLLLTDSSKVSLKTRPTLLLKEAINNLHLKSAISNETKWNRFRFIINKNKSIQKTFIWDEVWQFEIDSENKKVKEQNPDYNLPKWSWEK